VWQTDDRRATHFDGPLRVPIRLVTPSLRTPVPVRPATASEQAALPDAVRIERFTVGWMVVEAAVAIGAGVLAGSFLLIAFGLDSVIELVSGAILLWRLLLQVNRGTVERVEWAEERARWVVAIALTLLCTYVLATAVHGLVSGSQPDASPVGIAVSLAAIVLMPWLAFRKRRLAKILNSAALRGDAASSLTCAYMAGTVLVGLVLNAAFGWWWAEGVAALVFLLWLVQETREALEAARGGVEQS
jgi:divalent metal cation (Fe/Co/Zn/Cd) transporter